MSSMLTEITGAESRRGDGCALDALIDFYRAFNARNLDALAANWADGDAPRLRIQPDHPTIISCQYGRPIGRYAGYNVAADLLGQPLLPLRIDCYVTCVDLGPWGAVYTHGRGRILTTEGAAAKRTKRWINRERIVLPRDGRREVLGMDIGPSEAETFWTAFLRKLARRGLRGVKLVVSDAHEGIKATVAKVLNASWQRCRVHFMRNALAHAGKSGQRVVHRHRVRPGRCRDRKGRVAPRCRPAPSQAAVALRESLAVYSDFRVSDQAEWITS